MAAQILASPAIPIPPVLPSFGNDESDDLDQPWQESASWQDLLARDENVL